MERPGSYDFKIQCKKTLYGIGRSGYGNRAVSCFVHKDDDGSSAQSQSAICDRNDDIYRRESGNGGNGCDKAGGIFHGYGEQH